MKSAQMTHVAVLMKHEVPKGWFWVTPTGLPMTGMFETINKARRNAPKDTILLSTGGVMIKDCQTKFYDELGKEVIR